MPATEQKTDDRLSFASLAEALSGAKYWEDLPVAGVPQVPYYVVRSQSAMRARVDDAYIITARMPLLGEWWTSDGIKHG